MKKEEEDFFDIEKIKEFIKNPHDKYFQEVFSDVKKAEVFLLNFLPASTVKLMDLSTLKIEKRSYVSKRLRAYYSDLMLSVKILGKEVKIYILIEHKSYRDVKVALQMLLYMAKFYEDFRKYHKGEKLPVVIPIVVYHGEGELKIKNDFLSMVDLPSEELKKYVPDFKFELIDLNKESDQKLERISKLGLYLMLMKYIFTRDIRDLKKVVVKLRVKYGEEAFNLALYYIIGGARNLKEEEVKKLLEEEGGERMPSYGKIVFERGRKEGRLEELREAIGDILEIKFGKEALVYMEKIEEIKDLEELKKIKKRLKAAKSLEELNEIFD